MKHNVGEKVVLKNKRGSNWNLEGDMDKYIGKQVTIKSIDFLKDTFKIIEDNMNYWTFLNSDIDEEATAKLNEKWVSICELDWTEGMRYINSVDEAIWKVKEGSLVSTLHNLTPSFMSLQEISEMRFKKLETIWSKVSVDTKILVSNNGKGWSKRHFAKYEDGKVYFFIDGNTSWTQTEIASWNYAKLAEEE